MTSPYIMENGEEIRRLEMKTDAAAVVDYARRAGLREGMRVADVCCGAGVTTLTLADAAGPSGSAVGFDASRERIAYASERYGNGSTSFECADVRGPFGESGSFDFAWVRFALE